jgi:hypothetical protein
MSMMKRLAEGHIHPFDRDAIPTHLATDDEYGLQPKHGYVHADLGRCPKATVNKGRWPTNAQIIRERNQTTDN